MREEDEPLGRILHRVSDCLVSPTESRSAARVRKISKGIILCASPESGCISRKLAATVGHTVSTILKTAIQAKRSTGATVFPACWICCRSETRSV